jgi:hypothetical protein
MPQPLRVGLKRKFPVERVQIGSFYHRAEMLQVFPHCGDSHWIGKRTGEIDLP